MTRTRFRRACVDLAAGASKTPRAWRALLSAALLSATLAAASPARAQTVAESGPYRVSLYSTRLYAREVNQLEFLLADLTRLDADGNPLPLDRAIVRCVITMPAMPGMAAFDEVAHSEGSPGVYGVHPDFAHGGDYKLEMSLQIPVRGSIFARQSFGFDLPLRVLEPDEARLREGHVRTFSLRLANPSRPFRAGEPAELEFQVLRELEPEKNLQGVVERSFVPVTDFETRHERLAHLFIVRDDLGEFAHEHPAIMADGTARLAFVFPTAGRYRLFADVAPRGAGGQVVDSVVDVAGREPAKFDLNAQPPLTPASTTRAGTLTAEWTFAGLALPVRRTAILTATLRDGRGALVTDLQSYLGTSGHLVLVHADGQTFVHAHPSDGDAEDARRGQVAFVTWLPKAGLYRGWAQFQRDGQVLTTSFTVRAE